MDRDSLDPKTCIHSRKVSSFLDDPENAKLERFRTHLDECACCRNVLANEQGTMTKIDQLIPFVTPANEIATGIRSEIIDAFRYVEIEGTQSYAARALNIVTAFTGRVVGLLKFLLSKQMIITYLITGVTVILLKLVI